MSNESSATKWIVGCSVAGILCIVICLGVVGSMFFWGLRTARQGVQQAQKEVARQAQLMQEASNWSLPGGWTAPSEDAPVEALLPLQVGDWERVFQTTEASIPVVNIDRECRSGGYAANGQTVDVYVCRVSDNDREAVFEQAHTAIDNGGAQTTGSEGSSDGTTRQHMFYQTWGEQGRGWLIWDGGWLFAFHADDEQTPLNEFMTAYFAEIDARPSPDDASESDTHPEIDAPADSVAEPEPADDEARSEDAPTSATDAATP